MFSFGSDPEFMIAKGGKIKSAIGIIHGDIENRLKIKGHEFYYDNVLAECAIKPSRSKAEAVTNFKECIQIFAEMANPFQLIPQASHRFDRDELQHPDAKRVACDPEYCPYEMKMSKGPVEEILHGTLRTCGGHIHLGNEGLLNGHYGVLSMYMMDLFLGVPSLWLDKDPTSSTRREMYGAAGRYRVKEYGMEYRSLSNFWLQTPRFVEFIYDVSEFVTEYTVSGKANEHWTFDWDVFVDLGPTSKAWTCNTYDPNLIQEVIRTGDKAKAKPLFEMAQKLMPEKLKKEMLELCESTPKRFYEEWNIKLK